LHQETPLYINDHGLLPFRVGVNHRAFPEEQIRWSRTLVRRS
jgi:hypothetical protein